MIDNVADQSMPAVVFALRTRLFALEQHGDARLLPWLQRFVGASPVPGLPQWSLGLLNVRGTVQMAVDLGYLLGFGQSTAGPESRLIFLERGSIQLGLLVDAEIGVRYLRSAGEVPADENVPFATKAATLDGRSLLVLDGVAIIRHVAEQLGAPVPVL
jgi:purine-binding chemotaxis protein CheW